MYTVSSQGATPKRLLPGGAGLELDPTWSPDGKRVAFTQTGTRLGTPIEGAKNRILEVDTGKVTDLPPCPRTCYSLRWSPDGRYIAALTLGEDDLVLFDFETNRWSLFNLNYGGVGWPCWSHDGHFIYFNSFDVVIRKSRDPGIYRIPATGGQAEKIVGLKGFRGTGFLAPWSGLGPDDTPLLLRDVGTSDVYALTLERK
jgi:hypothetical protein